MIVVLLLLAYMVGSFPTAVIAGYMLMGKDIRNEGSGNAGATNVFRVLGPKAAIPVMLLDFSKAFFPVFFAQELASLVNMSSPKGELLQILFIFAIVIGHVFPLWARFRGGKGVASAAGGISALFPPAVPFCLLIFFTTAIISKYVSLASLLTAWTLPFFYTAYIVIRGLPFSITLIIFFFLIALSITFLHRKNIGRLRRGEENRISGPQP